MKINSTFLFFCWLSFMGQSQAVVNPALSHHEKKQTIQQPQIVTNPTEEEDLSGDWKMAIWSAALGTLGVAAGIVALFVLNPVVGVILLFGSMLVPIPLSITVWARASRRKKRGKKTPWGILFLSALGIGAVLFWVFQILTFGCC